MSEQFPIGGRAGDSKEALATLLEILGDLKDDRVLSWIVQWAHEKCQAKIIEREEQLMRQEHFGYTRDAEHTRAFLASYQEAMKIIVAIQDYVRNLVAEDFSRRMGDYFREQYGKPDVPTTAKEVKGIKGTKKP